MSESDPVHLDGAASHLQLDDRQYALIVAPVLQAAAEIAAARGDPDLINDMASMLALLTLVRDFGEFYLEQHPDSSTELREAVRHAPMAACAIPLQHAKLGAAQLNDCLWSLDAAARQLVDAGVVGSEVPRARDAWQALCADGDRDAALRHVKLAVAELVTSIDRWERAREHARTRAGERPG